MGNPVREADAQKETEYSKPFLLFLTVTALLCGAFVMVIEVLGSRVIGPFFGVSLFIWTSLITVTLVSLAAGYAAGGVMSDRWRSPDYLYGIILISGLFVLMIPFARVPVLKACQSLGLRTGSLVSSTVLFGPSLFLLGCVSPYIIRIATREIRKLGRIVGMFYGVSTFGSFLGTVLTGFVLIAYFGVSRIFLFIGLSQVLLSAAYFLLFRRRWRVASIALVASVIILLTAAGAGRPTVKSMPDGTTVSEVFSLDSFYGTIKVVDYSYGDLHTREMIIDGLVQSGVDMINGLSVYEYAYFMELLPYGIYPEGRDCLVIGLGAGIIPMWYERMGIATDVVEIDPEIPGIARRYFGFRLSGDLYIEDARYFLSREGKKYDYVVLDVFNGDTTPAHLLSAEAISLVRERLTPGGVLAMNLVGSLRSKTLMTASIVRTLETVFDVVAVYPAFSVAEGDGTGNLAVIAYMGDERQISYEAIRDFPVHPLARPRVEGFAEERFSFPPETRSMILTDNYNPIDFHDSWLKEKVRKDILRSTDWDILL